MNSVSNTQKQGPLGAPRLLREGQAGQDCRTASAAEEDAALPEKTEKGAPSQGGLDLPGPSSFERTEFPFQDLNQASPKKYSCFRHS